MTGKHIGFFCTAAFVFLWRYETTWQEKKDHRQVRTKWRGSFFFLCVLPGLIYHLKSQWEGEVITFSVQEVNMQRKNAPLNGKHWCYRFKGSMESGASHSGLWKRRKWTTKGSWGHVKWHPAQDNVIWIVTFLCTDNLNMKLINPLQCVSVYMCVGNSCAVCKYI